MSEFHVYEFMSAHPWPFAAVFAVAMLWLFAELRRLVTSK
jgi:hypothetical protein